MKLRYFFSETASNLRRNLLMTIAAISTVTISLLLLGGVAILHLAVRNMTYSWQAKIEISAYLEENITDGERQTLTDELSEMPQVEAIDYISQADALEEFQRQFRSQPELFEVLDEDSLPASIRVSLVDENDTEAVATVLRGKPGVDDVRYGGEIIKTLLQVNSFLRTITLVLAVVLMAAAAALIANTIRLGIFARREEIGIMKLVGATKWFIRIPFMLEGVFAALVGAIIAGSIVLLADIFLFPKMGEAFTFLQEVFFFTNGEIAQILGGLAVGGAVVGLIGSGMALRRFLEV
ncbi:MAG: permease-like cell division protein FtsX [Actinomycetota bacterium]|nr:permease-like cell division protein FtsX [Actinomycetota bacterium]